MLRDQMLWQWAEETEFGTAVRIDTGRLRGRDPANRFVVEDKRTISGAERPVDWWKINKRASIDLFQTMKQKIEEHLMWQSLYRHLWAAGSTYGNNRPYAAVELLTTWAAYKWFAHNMFLREQYPHHPDIWRILHAPSYETPEDIMDTYDLDKNATIINMTKKEIIINGTGYTGEIKKGVFSWFNYLMPQQWVLPMHCSANVGENGDVALLSTSGSKTLDFSRRL